MDIWKISLDQDGSTATDLSAYSSSIYVNVGIPKVKYNALSVLGHQGDIDMTAAYNGEVFYEPRECTVIIMSNSGADITASSVASALIDAYLGQRVRLQNITKNYMLIGRLTEAEYEELSNGKDYKIRFKLIAEPLRYSLSEQVINETQLTLTTPANQWATLTANKEHATSTGFSANAGETPLIQFSVTPNSNQYYRIVFSNLSNCTVRVQNHTTIGAYKYMIVDYNLPFIPKYDTLMVVVEPIDIEKPVSGSVYVGVYPATVIDYSGKPVAIKVAQTISDAHTDLYLLNNGVSAKLDYGSTYEEYPQLMLSTGANKLLAMASALDFDASTLGPTSWINIKWREGNL